MKFFYYLLFSLILIGCAAPIQNLTRTQYSNPAFSEQIVCAGGLALLPITAGQGQEGYRRPLGQYMNNFLAQAVPGGKVLTWESTMDSLNKCSLISDYQKMIENYRLTAIIDRELVKKLSSALGVRYALYCSLQEFSVKSSEYVSLSGTHQIRTADVSAHCLVLDLQTGDIMQEILGKASSSADLGYQSNSLDYEVYAQILAKSILMQIPGSKVQ